MATTGIINGTLVSLYKDVSGTLKKIANGTSAGIDVSTDMIDVSNKDSDGWKEFLAGAHGATMSFEGFMEQDGSVGAGSVSFSDLLADEIARTLITVVLTTNVTGDEKLTATAYISQLSRTEPYNDASSFTCTLQITGAVTPGVVA